MPDRPLVSVITPTWQRPELLAGAIENVRQQQYRPLEHVIVSDGPDRATARVAIGALDCADHADVLVRYVALGRNWSSYLPNSFCAAPTVVAMLVASGDYQTWLSDDECMTPDHIASLVTALENDGADFAYGRVRLYYPHQTPEQGWDIGLPSPQPGQITNALYRADLLKRGLFPFGQGGTADWACISNWINAGATWAYVDRVTMNHRVDH